MAADENLLSAMAYDGVNVSSGKISSMTENDALRTIEKTEELKQRQSRIKSMIANVEKAIDILPQEERRVIELKYIEGLQWWQVASHIHMSERNCRYKRKSAIDKMVIAMYGIE